MRAMFPKQESAGSRARPVIIAVVGIGVLVALAVFRAELRTQVRSLLGKRAVASGPAVRSTTHTVRTSPVPSGDTARRTVATTMPAAPLGAGAKAAAHHAADASNQQLAEQTGRTQSSAAAQLAPAQSLDAVADPAPSAPAAQPKTAIVAVKGGKAGKSAGTDATPAASGVMREVYGYDRDVRRDPFLSLLTTGDLRPTIADLKLMGILYDQAGRHSVAIMRDAVTSAQYRVTTGQRLGRMRVARITPKVVTFTIEEFGMNRQDSLVLGDTTKARAR